MASAIKFAKLPYMVGAKNELKKFAKLPYMVSAKNELNKLPYGKCKRLGKIILKA